MKTQIALIKQINVEYQFTFNTLYLVCPSAQKAIVHKHRRRAATDTAKLWPEICNNYTWPLYCCKLTKWTCIELNLHHIGKHPSRCFHSKILSAISAHGDYELERDIAVNRTETEWICEKVKIYIVFHPSKMGNGRH